MTCFSHPLKIGRMDGTRRQRTPTNLNVAFITAEQMNPAVRKLNGYNYPSCQLGSWHAPGTFIVWHLYCPSEFGPTLDPSVSVQKPTEIDGEGEIRKMLTMKFRLRSALGLVLLVCIAASYMRRPLERVRFMEGLRARGAVVTTYDCPRCVASFPKLRNVFSRPFAVRLQVKILSDSRIRVFNKNLLYDEAEDELMLFKELVEDRLSIKNERITLVLEPIPSVHDRYRLIALATRLNMLVTTCEWKDDPKGP